MAEQVPRLWAGLAYFPPFLPGWSALVVAPARGRCSVTEGVCGGGRGPDPGRAAAGAESARFGTQGLGASWRGSGVEGCLVEQRYSC